MAFMIEEARETEINEWGGEEERVSCDDSLPLSGSLKLRWVVVIDRQKVSLRALVVSSWGYGRTFVHSTVHSKTAEFFN